MNKFLLLPLIVGINIYSMNDDMASDDPQDVKPIWIPIKWRTVPHDQYNLRARIKAIKAVTTTLSTITQRIIQLPFHGERKEILVNRLQNIISNGLTCKKAIENTPLDPEGSFSEEQSLRALADSFLTPYHRSENELRTQVEILEQMVQEQNINGVDEVLARLEALHLD